MGGGTITKGLLKGLEDLEVVRRVETIQTTALLKTARILRRVLETWGDLLSLKLQLKTMRVCWCQKYPSLDTRDSFSSEPEINLDKSIKELEN